METDSKSLSDAGQRRGARFFLLLNIVLAFLAGVTLDRVLFNPMAGSSEAVNFRLIAEAQNVIQRVYVDRAAIKPRELTYGAINGMVDALGDTGHSTFLTPTMVNKLKDERKGELKGIGVEIQMKAGHVVVVAPMDGSPAQQAGLRPGDIVLKVYGQEITGWPLSRVVDKITGAPGTPVTLTILDSRTGRTRDVTIQRASIKIQNLTWRQLPGTALAHLRIASFDEGVTRDLRKILPEMEKANLKGIILDLRNNPGGVLDEAVGVTSQFLKGGNVLLVKDAQGKVTPVPVVKGGLATSIPMAVLINGGTASGAEIVAGALKDARRGPLIGETTFGTGTVLGQFKLLDGSGLLLAVEEWLTPNGESFWHKGIAPSDTVPLPDDATALSPAAERQLSEAELRASTDKQLLRAVEILGR